MSATQLETSSTQIPGNSNAVAFKNKLESLNKKKADEISSILEYSPLQPMMQKDANIHFNTVRKPKNIIRKRKKTKIRRLSQQKVEQMTPIKINYYRGSSIDNRKTQPKGNLRDERIPNVNLPIQDITFRNTTTNASDKKKFNRANDWLAKNMNQQMVLKPSIATYKTNISDFSKF